MENGTVTPSNAKIAEFQGLRAAALAGIIFYHYGNINLYRYAAWAVSLFFMLSGYLNGLSWSNGRQPEGDLKSSVSYMLRHIKKLYLLHIIMTVVSIPVAGIIPSIQEKGLKGLIFWVIIFFMNVTLTKSLYPKYYNGFNGVSWFLSTYAVLCLLTPALLHGVARIIKDKKIGTALKVMLTIFAAQFGYCFFIKRIGVSIEYWVYIFPLSRIGEYVIGIIAGMCSLKLKSRKRYGAAGWLAGIWIAVMIVCVPMPEWFFRSIAWIIPNVLLLWGVHKSQGFLSQILAGRPFVILGDYSANMYLIHQVVYGYFFQCGLMEGTMGKRIGMMLVNYILTLAFAVGFQRLITFHRPACKK